MFIAITQRGSLEHGGSDILESTYARYFNESDITLLPIPNNEKIARKYFAQMEIKGIVLSGGGSVYPPLYKGTIKKTDTYFYERDKTEETLLTIAIKQDIPVLGICRGMQALNVFFGGTLIQNLKNDLPGALDHKETRHMITLTEDSIRRKLGATVVEVNSHHSMGIDNEHVSSELIPFAHAADQTIEGYYHPNYPIAGIMWHPERENVYHDLNKLLVSAFLSRELFWKIQKKSYEK